MQTASQRQFERELGSEYPRYQLFIPAGRSFFTSMGKAVAAFEQGGVLDPATIYFGRVLANIRESLATDRYAYARYGRHSSRQMDEFIVLSRQLFGGTMKFSRDREYVETDDGRTIPFSFLSSGQQELLPLWLAIEYWVLPPTSNQVVYIEEPEAHLFPSAQNALMELLAQIVTSKLNKTDILITTHSPYLLSKINNLLKAGALATKAPGLRGRINSIIKKGAWLHADGVSAYAILDQETKPILDNDGLVDGAYLDEVSEQISREFNSLLGMEEKYFARLRVRTRTSNSSIEGED